MNIFKVLLERMVGRTISERNAAQRTAGAASRQDLVDVAKRTLHSTREPIKMEPPGRRLTAITTEDIDPATGKVYLDYAERRKRRQQIKDEPRLIYVVDDK